MEQDPVPQHPLGHSKQLSSQTLLRFVRRYFLPHESAAFENAPLHYKRKKKKIHPNQGFTAVLCKLFYHVQYCTLANYSFVIFHSIVIVVCS